METHLFALVDPTIVLGLTRPAARVSTLPVLLYAIFWLAGTFALILPAPSTRHLLTFLAAVASNRLSLLTRRAFAKVAQELRQSEIHRSKTQPTLVWSLFPHVRGRSQTSSQTGVMDALPEVAAAHLTVSEVLWDGQGTMSATWHGGQGPGWHDLGSGVSRK
jgi:hypothetical protein